MKNFRLLLCSAISVGIFAYATSVASLAASDDLNKGLRHRDNMKGDAPHVHEYDEIVSPDMESAWSIANRARGALKNGNVSRAMSLCQKAMKMDDDDMDIHVIYAQAMQAKLERQQEKDPDLFKKCVHEWILVYRNEVGMEKGMTFKGLNVMGNMYNDDEHGNLAKKQLKKLTGYVPKLWETDNHFIARVTKETSTSVSAKIKHGEDDEERPVRRVKSRSTEE